MTARRLCLLALTGAVGVLCAHVLDVSNRDTALARFLADENRGISHIVSDYGIFPGDCPAGRDGDLHSLAMAFVTVESFATSRLEGWARTLVAYGGAMAGLGTDISAGPGRIRMSTAHAALHDPTSDHRTPSDLALARELVTQCGAVKVAIQILGRIGRNDDSAPPVIDLRFIRAAAASYNGQSPRAASYQAALSAQLYVALVYAAYQHYRFAAL
jgi:hypothetical protein